MKAKKFLLALLVMFATCLVFSCKGKNKGNEETPTAEKGNAHKSVDDLLAHLRQYYSVSNKANMLYEMVGATDGCKVELDGEEIEIYKFDISQTKAKRILESVEQTNILIVSGFPLHAFANGSFVIYDKDVVDVEKLKVVFEKF